MTDERRQRVANPPTKPLLIWDGECHFCKLWSARWLSLSRTAKLFLPRKPSTARWDIDLREDGWRGATITFRDSQRFPKPLTSSSHVIADSARPLLDCYGEKTYGRQPTFGRGVGFFVRSD